MNPGSAAPDGPSSPRDTESTSGGAAEFEPGELTPPGDRSFGDRSFHRNITDKPTPGSASGADAEPAAGATGTNNVVAGDYTTVRVFYATDRTRLDAFDLRQLSWRPLPWLPVVALSAAAFALLTGSLFRKMSGRGWVAGLAAALSAVAILIAGGPLYLGQVRLSTLVERMTGGSRAADPSRSIASGAESTAGDQSATGQRADRAKPDLASSTPAVNVYGNGRGELEFGECEVTIPRRHEPGKIERPSLWRLEFHESLDRHVVLRTVERRGEDAFFTAVRERVASSPRSDLFVFIHGYNVSFDMAARRTAQMAHDLKFEGAPIFYSWPSQGGLLKYPVDETNVSWTVPHLKQFLRQLASRSEARAINVIAHSMGNRALASAVRELSLEEPLREKRFQQVVLAAPDIDAEVFQRDVAPLLASSAEHVTLYASSRDQALAASKIVHGYPRAGDSGAHLLVLPGIETVDVTEVDTGILGHSYYGNSIPILRDLERVLHGALTKDQRPWLQTAQRDGHPYWVFNDKSLAILQGNRHR
jgi:esterase/lipase superfamily enzyme